MLRFNKYLLFQLCVFATVVAQAQDRHQNAPSNVVLDHADVMPKFPGDLNMFLSKNIRYPETSDKITGRTIIQFVVRKSGYIDNLKIISSGGNKFDAEVIKMVRRMPRWIPGQQNGKPVSVRFTLPVEVYLD